MHTLTELKRLLDYNPDTGAFTWKVNRNGYGGGVKPGDVAENLNDSGYIVIRPGAKHYRAHRLAWLFMTGEWPTFEIDHINGVRTDNRWCNLRRSCREHNAQNIGGPRSDNTSGYLGVHWNTRRGKWVAQIKAFGKRHHLGYFPTPELAHAAYLKAKDELHPTHQRLRNQGA